MTENEISQYMKQTKFIILATVDANGAPALRTMGGFAVDGLTVYISTKLNTAKVSQIKANPNVSVYFQHENQAPNTFVNVLVQGRCVLLDSKEERDQAIEVLCRHNSKFKERADKGAINNDDAFLRVEPKKVKILDRTKGPGLDIQEMTLE